MQGNAMIEKIDGGLPSAYIIEEFKEEPQPRRYYSDINSLCRYFGSVMNQPRN